MDTRHVAKQCHKNIIQFICVLTFADNQDRLTRRKQKATGQRHSGRRSDANVTCTHHSQQSAVTRPERQRHRCVHDCRTPPRMSKEVSVWLLLSAAAKCSPPTSDMTLPTACMHNGKPDMRALLHAIQYLHRKVTCKRAHLRGREYVCTGAAQVWHPNARHPHLRSRSLQ